MNYYPVPCSNPSLPPFILETMERGEDVSVKGRKPSKKQIYLEPSVSRNVS